MSPLTPVIAIALLIATVKTVTDFPAYVSAKQWSAVIKQVLAWVVGIGLAFVLAASDLGDSIQATDTMTLGNVNHWTVALFGLAAASGAGLTHQYMQARDSTQSAYVPPIVNQPSQMGASVPPPTSVTSAASGPMPTTPSVPGSLGLNVAKPS